MCVRACLTTDIILFNRCEMKWGYHKTLRLISSVYMLNVYLIVQNRCDKCVYCICVSVSPPTISVTRLTLHSCRLLFHLFGVHISLLHTLSRSNLCSPASIATLYLVFAHCVVSNLSLRITLFHVITMTRIDTYLATFDLYIHRATNCKMQHWIHSAN